VEVEFALANVTGHTIYGKNAIIADNLILQLFSPPMLTVVILVESLTP
jgi:hypothetical protein